MARYHDAKCRLCRREGTRLNLKGARCESDKCAFSRRSQAPGQHGTSRKALSEYGKQLREKQKAKRTYGILERQFKNYVTEALKSRGVSGEILLQKLESRLDNLVYRSGFAVSRAQARQYIRRGYFMVNDRVVTIPSQQAKIGDTVKPISFDKIQPKEGFVLPEWLAVNVKEKSVKIAQLPTLDKSQEKFDLQSIIEYYSR
jgi:small subunit ribosomal protein S4